MTAEAEARPAGTMSDGPALRCSSLGMSKARQFTAASVGPYPLIIRHPGATTLSSAATVDQRRTSPPIRTRRRSGSGRRVAAISSQKDGVVNRTVICSRRRKSA